MECQNKADETSVLPLHAIRRPPKFFRPIKNRIVADPTRNDAVFQFVPLNRCIQPSLECFRDVFNSITLVITKISTPEAICVCVKSNYSPRAVNWQTKLLKAENLESPGIKHGSVAQKRIRLQLKSCWNVLSGAEQNRNPRRAPIIRK